MGDPSQISSFVIPALNLMVVKLYEESSKLFFFFQVKYPRSLLSDCRTSRQRNGPRSNSNRFIKASLE